MASPRTAVGKRMGSSTARKSPPKRAEFIRQGAGTESASAATLVRDYGKAEARFAPAALMREARRQKGLASVDVPSVCILDPDGDIVRRLLDERRAQLFENWPCYHTDLHTFPIGSETVGILGRAVGVPFAVLVAE